MATIQATKEINRLARLSFKVGCAQDQLARFLQAGYVPQPRQLEFHAAARECDEPSGPDRVGYGGTRGQAKSHAVLAQAVIDDMQRFDGLKWLYLRKIQKKAQESFDDLRRKVLRYVPHSTKNGLLTLPNDSLMILGGFRSESEIDAYLGLEYDGVVIEDATALTESKRDVIRGSLRTSRSDWRPRLYESANPGGVGHAWFKRDYYDPWRRGPQTETRFIHTTYGDNVFINPEYGNYLDGLTGWLRRAWRDGDFEISAGQFFIHWDPDVHVVKSFEVPRGWHFWLAMDYGFIHWNVVLLLARDGDGNVYVLDEHAERRWLVEQHAKGISAMLERNGLKRELIREFLSGPDVFARRDEETIADKYDKLGWKLTPAQTDRVNGAAEVLARLGNPEAGLQPSMFVFERCHKLIECLPAMEHDPRRPEDVLKTDCDPDTGEGGDDPYDTLRYGLMIKDRSLRVMRYRR